MRRRCPNCKSLNVRRSSQERGDAEQPLLRSPYRCRDCETKFWALSTKVYRRMVLIIAVNVVFFGLIVYFLLTVPE
jgi:transposase-like protein